MIGCFESCRLRAVALLLFLAFRALAQNAKNNVWHKELEGGCSSSVVVFS